MSEENSKFECRIPKQIPITKIRTHSNGLKQYEPVSANNENAKPYDLEERTAVFGEQSRAFFKRLDRTIAHVEDAKQFIRASGSIGAKYIEANEAIGKKDFVMKIKICRREAKESRYWLRLLDVDGKLEQERQQLSTEAQELMKIFGAILRKCE
jgi:four helix bundle protein